MSPLPINFLMSWMPSWRSVGQHALIQGLLQ